MTITLTDDQATMLKWAVSFALSDSHDTVTFDDGSSQELRNQETKLLTKLEEMLAGTTAITLTVPLTIKEQS